MVKIVDEINLKDGEFVNCTDGHKRYHAIWNKSVGRFAIADKYGCLKRGYYTDIYSFEKAVPEVKKA